MSQPIKVVLLLWLPFLCSCFCCYVDISLLLFLSCCIVAVAVIFVVVLVVVAAIVD